MRSCLLAVLLALPLSPAFAQKDPASIFLPPEGAKPPSDPAKDFFTPPGERKAPPNEATPPRSVSATLTPPLKGKIAEVVKELDARLEPAQAKRGETVTFKLTIKLAEGWYTYPTRQADATVASSVNEIEFPDTTVVALAGPVKEPPSKEKDDQGVRTRYYTGEVTFEQALVVRPGTKPGDYVIPVQLQILACKEICLPPAQLEGKLKLTVLEGDAPVDPKRAGEPTAALGSTTGTATDSVAGVNGKNGGLLAFLLQAIGWGAASIITPCVFPMIPITVSFFQRHAERENHRPLTMALVYTLTIVTVLTIGLVALFETFAEISGHWATNLFMGALFVTFALSLFGLFEIRLPSGLIRFTSAHEGQGGLVGTVFMALTFTIVSFSCMGPYATSFAALGGQGDEDRWHRVLGAVVYSVTFASPFFVLALFPKLARQLPKSGSWMTTVMTVVAFILMAVAFKFLRAAEISFVAWRHGESGEAMAEFLTYDLVLALYVALSILCALYLLGLFRLPHDTPGEHLGVGRLVWSLVFLGLGLYLLPGVVGQVPRGKVYEQVSEFLLPDAPSVALNAAAGPQLVWHSDVDAALALAKRENRPIFIDFTGRT